MRSYVVEWFDQNPLGQIGVILMRVLEATQNMTMVMSADVVQLAIGFSMAVGVIFGLYPAGKASRLRPIQALRYDG